MLALTIAGRIGKDAETRTLQSGDTTVTGFSVAVDDRSGKEKQTLWFDVSIWGKRGAALEQYLTKGTSLTVSGSLGRREHDVRTYLTLRADNVTLQGGGRSDDRDSPPQHSGGYGGSGGGGNLDDEIPFAPEWRA